MLVRDQDLPFEAGALSNSREAQTIIRKLIETCGQSDREQFCVVVLDNKNVVIGLNIVSIGAVSSAPVHPREVLKPAILASATAMILAHNHPSEDVSPSREDEAITARIIKAAHIIGIKVHEHLIISMCDDRYYSFADNGIIKKIYDAKGMVPTVVKKPNNVFEVIGVRKKDEKIVYEDEEAPVSAGAMAVAGEATITVPPTAADIAVGLDPFYSPNEASRAGRWDYTKWTPGLERSFAPTFAQKNWS